MSYLDNNNFDLASAQAIYIPETDVFDDGYEIADFLRSASTPVVTEFIDRNRSQFEQLFSKSLQADEAIDIDLLIEGLDSELDSIADQCRDIINLSLDRFPDTLHSVFFEQPLKQPQANVSLAIPTQRRIIPSALKALAGAGSLLAAASVAGYLNTSKPEPELQPPQASALGAAISVVESTYALTQTAVPYVLKTAQTTSRHIKTEFETATTELQNAMLSVRQNYPNSYYNPFLVKNLEDNPKNMAYLNLITEAALEKGLDPVRFANQLFRESAGFNEKVITGDRLSRAGAVGIAQIMPSTGRERGLSDSDLRNPRTSIFAAADIMAENVGKFGDQGLAEVAYNGGAGAVAFVKEELGQENITIQDWLIFNQNRRIERGTSSGSAWHVETYAYVRDINGQGWEQGHKQWSRQQQKDGLPMNMAAISLMIADHHGSLDTQNTFIAALIKEENNPNLS